MLITELYTRTWGDAIQKKSLQQLVVSGEVPIS